MAISRNRFGPTDPRQETIDYDPCNGGPVSGGPPLEVSTLGSPSSRQSAAGATPQRHNELVQRDAGGLMGDAKKEAEAVETVERLDNMATLPVASRHGASEVAPEKNNSTNKEMEAKKSKVPRQQEDPKRICDDPNDLSAQRGHPLAALSQGDVYLTEEISRPASFKSDSWI
ncbi:hypothetical protein AAG570_005789 [Ranatra chinensis]|uniref:Prolactin receptor n=1 Tax=Ranatra chinensis TaxID=642074 RepID=A0ABD0YK77_9HEMI